MKRVPELYTDARGWRLLYNVVIVTYLWLWRGLLCRHVWKDDSCWLDINPVQRCTKCGAYNTLGGWYWA